jgi:hypothetical protein
MLENERHKSTFAEFVAKIEDRITNLTTLDIKTVVGEFGYDSDKKVTHRNESDFKIMSSEIKLIEGDVTTKISTELMEDKYDWLRRFHAEKEEKGHEIVKGNIEAILSLFKLYRETKDLNYDETRVDETLFEPETLEEDEEILG